MPKQPQKTQRSSEVIVRSVDRQVQRKVKARRDKRHGVWFGLGMFGLIGWSIAIPTLAGIALGIWLDKQWPVRFSWTLTLMFGGLVLGCLNAWRWIGKERRDD